MSAIPSVSSSVPSRSQPYVIPQRCSERIAVQQALALSSSEQTRPSLLELQPRVTPPHVQIGENKNGRTVKVPENGMFTISLRETSITQFHWSAREVPSALGWPVVRLTHDDHPAFMGHKGGTRTFTWTINPMLGAKQGTKIPVSLEYNRLGSSGVARQTFSVKIKIT